MRPINGVVVDIKGPVLVIKLESGLIIRTQKTTGYGIGTRCRVSYDFTTNKVVKLYEYKTEIEEEDHTKEIVVEDIEAGEDSDVVETIGLCDSDSEALPPDSGDWEFWSSDSGILELS